ncbi:MAG TPA: RsmE family RNA methyltransferase [Gemmatimonadaceae bacterium]|nr:RsmE family RNA methyltransferase [Gemmatimonadaceae bacterium]
MNASAPRFLVEEGFAARTTVTVGEDAARHMRVLRLGPGAPVTLLDGDGERASGTLQTLGKHSATVAVDAVEPVAPLPAVHALVPIADRDRMLWLAEKSAELSLTSWRPVLWSRSRSVTPRGDSPSFHAKVRARMCAAIEQSGNAWLPTLYPTAPLERAIAALPPGTRVVLDGSGSPMRDALRAVSAESVVLAIGPEGGLDDDELTALDGAGFVRASLGAMTLRFETAAIVALANARAALAG